MDGETWQATTMGSQILRRGLVTKQQQQQQLYKFKV